MKFDLGQPIKISIKSFRMILGSPYFIHRSSIWWLQLCGYLRSVLEDHFIIPHLHSTPTLHTKREKKDKRKMFWYFNIWVLDQLLFAGAAGGIWAYNKRKQNNNVHVMALNLVRGVALSPKEKQTMLDLLTPPPPERSTLYSWWKKRLGQ